MNAIASDWRGATLSPADQELCRFAEKLTQQLAETGPEDIARLRALGFEDRAIHDATQVVAYFNYITRVAEGLGVEPEDFIEPWGVDRP